jgi:hypothetical protein
MVLEALARAGSRQYPIGVGANCCFVCVNLSAYVSLFVCNYQLFCNWLCYVCLSLITSKSVNV